MNHSTRPGAARRRNYRGFTFLEVLVISGIIAAISVGTYGYMAVTQSSVRLSRAVQDIQAIRAAANNWATGRNNFFNGITMTKVFHLLPPRVATATPATAGTGTNPWKGNYTLAAKSADDTRFVITVTKVPNTLGESLKDRLNGDGSSGASFTAGTGTITSGSLTAEYE